jgi:hypothetical protein
MISDSFSLPHLYPGRNSRLPNLQLVSASIFPFELQTEGSLQTGQGQVWLRSVGFPRGQHDASSWQNAQVDRIKIDDNSSQTLSSMITLIFKQNSLQTVSICYFVVLSDLEQNQQLPFSLFSPLSHDVMHRVSAAALLLCWTLAPILPSANSSWGRFAVIPPVSNPRSRQNVEAARELEEFLEEHAVPAPDADLFLGFALFFFAWLFKVRILWQFVDHPQRGEDIF